MGRDANIAKRNAFAIPGALLLFYGITGFLLAWLRGQSGACHDGMRIMYHGACFGLAWPLGIGVVAGATLLVVGITVFRGKPEGLAGQLHPGTPTHVGLALLISLVAVPLVGAGIAAIAQGRLGTVLTEGTEALQFKTTFLLEVAALVGLLMLTPFLILLLRSGARRRQVLREAETMAEETHYPGEGGPTSTGVAPPEEFVDEAAWPAARH